MQDAQTMRFFIGDIKRVLFLCLCIFFVLCNRVTAQVTYQLPPNQPEQDACNALQLCGGIFSTPYSYTGTGRHLDLDESPCQNQPGGGEQNSVWLKLQVATAGTIIFKLTPVSSNDDYDFLVVNATGKDCGTLTPKDVVRCNYNNNLPGSNANGVIGISDTSRTPYILKGVLGWSFCEAVYAKANEVYLIMINNYGNYVGGGPSKGFSIDFTGSSATFYAPASPQLTNIDVPCNNAKSIILKTSAPVLCNSIASDGSDFTTNAPANIISASGINSTSRGGYTNLIQVNFSSVLPAGGYVLNSRIGSDNNSLLGLCNDDLIPGAGVPFIVKVNSKVALDNESICYEQLPIIWNGMLIRNGGDSVATYTTSSSDGCDSTAILNLHVSLPPQQIVISKTICDGDNYLLPWDSTVTTSGAYIHHYLNSNGCDSIIESVNVNVFVPPAGNVQERDSTYQTGFCENGSVLLRPQNSLVSYLWNTGQTTSSIVVNVAGAYSLVAKDTYGCTTIDTFVVAAYQFPAPGFDSIENLCFGGTKILDGGISSTYYLWSNGSNSEKITVTQPGKYWVMLTSAHNCTATDTVNVVLVQNPANFLVTSITKCSSKDTTLSPISDFDGYMWSNGSNAKSIEVSKGGLYWLDVTDQNGCIGRDSIMVIDSLCPVYIFIPDAFTPNGDGLNDIFKPTFSGTLSGYHFSVYNRWGGLVFSTDDPARGWDGTLEGRQQPIGVYVWICTYILDAQSVKTDRGTVTLLR
jgi:gliding motility-associated-like protein